MILQLAICSSLLAASGAVTGRVESTGKGEVAVWLEPLKVDTEATARPGPKRTIDQRNKTFVPHLLVTQSGSSVAFPNHDPFFHNAFSNYSGQVFDTGLYAPGTSKVITFRRPGIARVFCNIHPTMSAVVVVVDSPYYAVASKTGTFSIPDVPPGEYQLRVFYERTTEAVLNDLSQKVTVGPDGLTVPAIKIPDSGISVPPPHKNKFGKDYPAVIVDQYPGKTP
jgi:plastocyanin